MKTKLVSPKTFSKPWLTSALLNSTRNKSNYFKKFKLGLITELFYKNYRNKLTSLRRISKKNYFRAKFLNCKNDLKSTWKILNKLMSEGSSNKKEISSIIVDGCEVGSTADVANHFNQYFNGVATALESKIPPPFNNPLSGLSNLTNSLFIFPTTPSEIVKTVKGLKNSSYGLNSIPARIFKLAADSLSTPISKLVNNSFAKGNFPDILKKAVVVPIFKKGDPQNISNFRPISILPLLSKIFE